MSKRPASPFSTPLEAGVRSLFVLAAAAPRGFDLQELVYLDYLVVHSGDLDGGPASIHPSGPLRTGEWLVRRSLVEAGLMLMFCKELVTKDLTEHGIYYRASDLARPFLVHLKSEYAVLLRERAQWLAARMHEFHSGGLRRIMDANVGKWGAELRGEASLLDTGA